MLKRMSRSGSSHPEESEGRRRTTAEERRKKQGSMKVVGNYTGILKFGDTDCQSQGCKAQHKEHSQ